jgi:LPS export ABC transporter permease LptF/LPS export ABC transporter permease LptG
MRTFDRYVLRQVFWPMVLGLLVFTFLLILPLILRMSEELITKGVPALVVLRLAANLLPQALGLSIPMSLLLGLLLALGKLSSDSELVALQACGMSIARLLRPVAAVTLVAFGATLYILLAALPAANQASREIMFAILADRAEGEVKPRVFFDKFPNLVLYVREVPLSGGWRHIFMADTRPGQPQAAYLARTGHVVIDRAQRRVEMVLENGSRHVAADDGSYEVSTFDEVVIGVNPAQVFPSVGPSKGVREMSIGELQTLIADLERQGQPTLAPWIEIHKKFSIPFACVVLGLIGVALGATNRRGGRLGSFVIGIGIIFTYYALLESASNLAKGNLIPTWLAVWLPNIAFGALGVWLFVRGRRSTGRSSRLVEAMARVWRAVTARLSSERHARVPMAMPVPFLGLLDRYVMVSYLRIFALSVVALSGLAYLSSFIDLSDEVLRGDATWRSLGAFLVFITPQNLYFVLPMSVLLATLVTIGLLTRNSELVVMKACGISLYRVAMPLVVVGLVATGALSLLQESLLGPYNQRAIATRLVITGQAQRLSQGLLNRRWLAGGNGDIYNYASFDPTARELSGLSIFEFEGDMERVVRRTFAERATFDADGSGVRRWEAARGWTRDFGGQEVTYTPFEGERLTMEPAEYFSTEVPDPEFMNYPELSRHVTELQAGGFETVEQRVALARKVSFPFVTLIMTLIAVPFAVTTGTRGAMYGIGAGLVLAFSYWGALSVFGAIGAAGLLTPLLAAWAPNLLFGAGAVYLVLTVRT